MEDKDMAITSQNAEELSRREKAEFIIDMFHRIIVHHTLWLREVEHQMGFEKAMEVMDRVWGLNRKIAVKRLSRTFDFPEEEGIPSALITLPEEKQLSLMDDLAKNWLAQDGVWFQSVEMKHGMNEAKRCNDSTWARFSPFEARSIKKFLGLGDHPGLKGLKQALDFRMYGRINRQSCHYEGDALIFEMNCCRVQDARKRKGMADYPCKSAGLVEYSRFAEAIDDRIQTECIGCPPDGHPEDWFCAWKFTIPSEKR